MIRIEASTPVQQSYWDHRDKRRKTRQVQHYTRTKIDGREFKFGAPAKKRTLWGSLADAFFRRTA